jgi:Thioesterase-like superfamily
VIFRSDGDAFVPTGHARGPWDPDALHGGAPAALVAREVERLAPEMRLARVTLEILGPVPLAALTVEAEIVRPGRRFQLAEATLTSGDRVACRARAVLLRRGDVDGVPRGDAPVLDAPGPDAAERLDMGPGESFGGTGMDIRFVRGHLFRNGPAVGWFRLALPLVDDEEPTPAQRALAAADFGNGASRVIDWDEWLFVNTDLTVHLQRDPVGEWVALDARTVLEPDGSGLAVSDLHDARGPIGVALQSLFVDRR